MIYVYLAAPVRPLEGSGETKAGNLALALEYYRQLSLRHLDCVFLMPWWANCHAFEETPEMIALGMKRNHAVIDLVAEHEERVGGNPYMPGRGGQLWAVLPTGRAWGQGMLEEARYAVDSCNLLVRQVDAGVSDQGTVDFFSAPYDVDLDHIAERDARFWE